MHLWAKFNLAAAEQAETSGSAPCAVLNCEILSKFRSDSAFRAPALGYISGPARISSAPIEAASDGVLAPQPPADAGRGRSGRRGAAARARGTACQIAAPAHDAPIRSGRPGPGL